jgi:hypothetical protein
MITIGANGERIAYGIKHYNLDDESDLKKLPKAKELMGCTCFVIETSKYYMLNSRLKWVEISPFGKVISNNGGNNGDGDDDNPEIPDDDDIIYEGGII